MAGTSTYASTDFFVVLCFLAAGALAGAFFVAALLPVLAAALVVLEVLADLDFFDLSSFAAFLVSFLAALAVVLEGVLLLPVSFFFDLVSLVSLDFLVSFLSSDYFFFGLAASSALILAVYAILSFSYLALSCWH